MKKLFVQNTKYSGRVCIGFENGRSIIDVWSNEVIDGQHDFNLLARRLVAAYNACEGIETESLELQVANGGISKRMKAQNHELLEALEMAYQEIKDITESAFCSVSAEKEVMDKIRAAIAKAASV